MGLFGNQQQPSAAQQHDYQDFANRYSQGAPAEGYSDQEVTQRYQQVAQQLPPEQFQQAAQQSFANMPPEQRQQFGQLLQQQAQQQGVQTGGSSQGNFQDPAALAQFATQIHQQQPSVLGGLLSGGQQGGGTPSTGGQTWQTLDPQTQELFVRQWGNRAQEEWEKENARNTGGGGAAGGGVSGMLGSPVAKAAMAGIAAMAIKNLVSGR